VATSYVLKAPPAPPAERVIVKEACVTKTPENVSKPETTNADDTQEKAAPPASTHEGYLEMTKLIDEKSESNRHTDLIQWLRTTGAGTLDPHVREAADALEAQATEIHELKVEIAKRVSFGGTRTTRRCKPELQS